MGPALPASSAQGGSETRGTGLFTCLPAYLVSQLRDRETRLVVVVGGTCRTTRSVWSQILSCYQTYHRQLGGRSHSLSHQGKYWSADCHQPSQPSQPSHRCTGQLKSFAHAVTLYAVSLRFLDFGDSVLSVQAIQ